MQKFGIDTSKWQGDFDFVKAKTNEGVEFAILKIGGGDAGLYKDSQFDNSYAKCEKAGLPKGCYFFGEAMTIEDAKKEAEYWLSLMRGKKFEYPVFYDVEARMLDLSKRTLTDIIKTVCSIIEGAGYWVGVYGASDNLIPHTYFDEITRYSMWLAKWAVVKPDFAQIWQFGGETNFLRSSKINDQVVDQNYCYVDYPTLIKDKGLNGYTKVVLKSVEEIAKEVIAGKWGNGNDRKIRLTQAGYDYTAVQSKVDELFSKKSVDTIAREVIAGKWGNGQDRINRLEKAGYNVKEVQARVNKLLTNTHLQDNVRK